MSDSYFLGSFMTLIFFECSTSSSVNAAANGSVSPNFVSSSDLFSEYASLN